MLALGFAATLLSLLGLMPQVTRVVRTRVIDGISLLSLLLGLLTFSLWGTYGLAIGDPAQILTNGAYLAGFTVLVWYASGASWRRSWWVPLVPVAMMGLAVGLSWLSAPALAATAGATVGAIQRLPQVFTALSGVPLWGLSPHSVLLTLASALAWTGYGVAAGDLIVFAASVLGATMQTVIVWRRLPPHVVVAAIDEGRTHRLAQSVLGGARGVRRYLAS